MALPAIPDELLVEILLRLPTAADLIRASAACVSFRRLIAGRSFTRRFRKLHPPPLLGFLDTGRLRFHPAVPPHPSAPAARAVARAADFSFDFLPSPSPYRPWSVQDVRDGWVLLERPRPRPRRRGAGLESPSYEMVVCDPLHRHYLLLPRIPDDLAASVVGAQGFCHEDSCLVPSGDDEEAAATDEASFRVIWMLLHPTKPVIFLFCSGTQQWRIVPSLTWSEMSPGFELPAHVFYRLMRHYAHGCFYWLSYSTEKLFVLEIRRMEFSVADHPPCERKLGEDVVIAEADQGMILMFVPKPDTSPVIYTVWRNNGGRFTQWQMEKPITLDSGSGLMGAVGRHLLIYYCGTSSVGRSCFTQDVNTFQLEWVCSAVPKQTHAYCNFPPSLLSSPTVSTGTHHADIQRAGVDVPVPQLRESDSGGMEGPVIPAAARASNPLFVVEGTPHADVHGVGDDMPVPELPEADFGGVQGPVVAAAARAPNPCFDAEGTPHGDVQGEGDDVPVPELQEANPGGVQGSVVAAAARAPTPSFVVEATPHADIQEAEDIVPVPEPREAGPEGVILCNAGTPQGAGDTVLVPEAREAGPGGMQGPVLASAAQAPKPSFDNNGVEAGRGGARRWRWGWGWTCGVCRGQVAEV
ncbi:hypothetical protein CFC21_021672 [Triticum aestivum]|uniref:F-box domain-containing protein n=2 Tax=Triticum aestivum TaxID=4565 RepID=A0A3B6BZY6_WHEAT|nr:hypothetical protein CFC21_021672 [Triticum aestivum]